MKWLPIFTLIVAAGMLLAPSAGEAKSSPAGDDRPPIEQTLVREGDFALKLIEAYNLGVTEDEAEAERILSSMGIEPKNGWIADYPMTPDIIGELREDIITAAEADRLIVARSDAVKIFDEVKEELGLPIIAGAEHEYEAISGATADEAPLPPEPTVINNHYYDEGPPVVTYYPPPPAYSPYYSWVPYPFFWSGVSLGGFFILDDFHRHDRVVVVNKRVNKIFTNKIVSNHVLDPSTNRIVRLNALRRGSNQRFRPVRDRLRVINDGNNAVVLSNRGNRAARLQDRAQRSRALRADRVDGGAVNLNNRRAAVRARVNRSANRNSLVSRQERINRTLSSVDRNRALSNPRNRRSNVNALNRGAVSRQQRIGAQRAGRLGSNFEARRFRAANREAFTQRNQLRGNFGGSIRQRPQGQARSFSSPRAFGSGGSSFRSSGGRMGGGRAFRSGGGGMRGGGGFARGGGSRGGGCRRC